MHSNSVLLLILIDNISRQKLLLAFIISKDFITNRQILSVYFLSIIFLNKSDSIRGDHNNKFSILDLKSVNLESVIEFLPKVFFLKDLGEKGEIWLTLLVH